MAIPTFEEFRQQKYGDAYEPLTTRPTATSTATSTGMDPEMMRKLFAVTALNNPNKASNLSTIFNLINPPETAEVKNRRAAMEPAASFISSVRKLGTTGAGTVAADTVLLKENLPMGLGRKLMTNEEQNLVSLHQQLQLLKQNVVRSLQGARMSDMDIKIAESYIPTIQDTPKTIDTKLTNLESFINSLKKNGSTAGSNTETTQPPSLDAIFGQ